MKMSEKIAVTAGSLYLHEEHCADCAGVVQRCERGVQLHTALDEAREMEAAQLRAAAMARRAS